MHFLIHVAVAHILFLSIFSRTLYADGSRSILNENGHRAFLEGGYGKDTAGIDRLNTFYVYARAGEKINLGSSALGINQGNILFIRPDGVESSCLSQGDGLAGKINSISEELSGPSSKGGYVPCELDVQQSTEGIWAITFLGPDPHSWKESEAISVSQPWVQAHDVYTVVAWDITVFDPAEGEKPGRVFVEHLPLTMGDEKAALFSSFYAMTQDGYVYKIGFQGLQAHSLMLFASRDGFIKEDNREPLYKSVPLEWSNTTNKGLPAGVAIEGPGASIAENSTIHKLFFAPPSPDLPERIFMDSGVVHFPGEPSTPATPISFRYNGSVGKAGTFSFESHELARYRIDIDVNNNGVWGDGSDVVVHGDAEPGINFTSWNGLDRNGNSVQAIEGGYQARIVFIAGEFHLPFIDVEANPYGIEMSQVNGFTQAKSLIYYDDTLLEGSMPESINTQGVDSQFGVHSYIQGFGDSAGIDTWTYSVSEPVYLTERFYDLQGDLRLVASSLNTIAAQGDEVEVAIRVSNDGPDATTDVRVKVHWPDIFFYQSSAASAGVYEQSTGIWEIDSIAVAEEQTLYLSVRTSGSGSHPIYTQVIDMQGADSDSRPNNLDIEYIDRSLEDDEDVLLIHIDPDPQVGVASRVVGQNGNATEFESTIEVLIENIGNTPLEDVQAINVLPDALNGTDYEITALNASAPLVANPFFDGKNDLNMLQLTGSTLLPGEKGLITYSIRIIPFTNLGPFSSTVEAYGSGPDNNVVRDLSIDGNVVDPNANGFAGDPGEDVPTLIEVTHRPALAAALDVYDITGRASSFSASCRLVLKNLGDVPLRGIQAEQALATIFGKNRYDISNLQVDSPLLSINAGYNGDDDIDLIAPAELSPGSEVVITFNLNAYPSVESAQYTLQALVRGVSPSGLEIFDASDSGSDPDANGNNRGNDAGEGDPTVIKFGQNPVIGASLMADRVTGDLGGFSAEYTLRLKNLGDVPLYNLQAINDLDKAFPGAEITVTDLSAIYAIVVNPSFDGRQNKSMIAGQDIPLYPGETFQLSFTVDVIPQSYFGPYEISTSVRGKSDAEIVTTDLSNSGPQVDPDGDGNPDEESENEPNELRFAPNAAIGAALGINAVSGDLEEFNLGYTIVLENHSDIPLSSLSLNQALDSTFANARFEVRSVTTESSLILNPLFDGKEHTELIGANSPGLGVGESASIVLEIEVNPRGDFGPYALGAFVVAETPFETIVSDQSNSGLNTDPNGNGDPSEAGENTPALVLLDEKPAIGSVLYLDELTGNLESFTAKHVIIVKNLGDVPLGDLQAELDVAGFYEGAEIQVLRHSARGTLSINEAFDGQQDTNLLIPVNSTLAMGDTARIEIDVLVKPGENFGPFVANAVVIAEGPGGTAVTDISDVGKVIDINQNGVANENSENRPLSVVPEMKPSIGIARTVSTIQEGPDETYLIQFDLLIRNLGDVPLSQISLFEDLKEASGDEGLVVESVSLSDGSPFALNSNFDGIIDKDILSANDRTFQPGARHHVYLTIRTTPSFALSQFESRSRVSGLDPRGNRVEDWSNDGVVADPNGNGVANEDGENTPTVIVLGLKRSFEFNSRLVHIEGETGNYKASLEAIVVNTTNRELKNLQLELNVTDSVQPEVILIDNISLEGSEAFSNNERPGNEPVIDLFAAGDNILPAGEYIRANVDIQINGAPDGVPSMIRFDVNANMDEKPVAVRGVTLPVYIQTSTGEDGGLESNGNLAMLLAERSYRRQHEYASISQELRAGSYPLHMAGYNGVLGKGSLLRAEAFDLIPLSGPEGSVAIVKTPEDLYGVTNATSVLATDYMLEDQRVAGLFATTTPAGETYEHSKNICDRLKGSTLDHVELVSIRGYPFVLSILKHRSGEVDYAISFITYKNGASHLIDSRFVLDQYDTEQIAGGEILNFQVWSYSPAFTIEIIEDILERMEESGRVDFVAREDNIPQVPSTFVSEGGYGNGTLFLRVKNTEGVSQLQITGETSRTEHGENQVFEHVVVVPETYKDSAFVPVVINSGALFDALLYVTNDHNEDVDQIYVADGAWGQIVPESEETVVEIFDVLTQREYSIDESRFVIERGLHFKGALTDSVTIFRKFKPGGTPVNMSRYDHLTFTARGKGKARVQVESFSEKVKQSGKEFELGPNVQTYTVKLDDLKAFGSGVAFDSERATAISFVLNASGGSDNEVELIVEDIYFSRGAPVDNENEQSVPDVYLLSQNYPNPFSTGTTIAFSVPEPSEVNLAIYDLLGRRVKEVVDAHYTPGQYKIKIENRYLSSGMYVYRLVANEHVLTKTMHVIR